MTKCSDLIREEENFPGGQIDTIQTRELDPMLPLRLRFFATSSPLPSQIHWRTLYAASILQGAIPIVYFAVQVHPAKEIGGSRQPRELKKLDKDHR